MFPNGVTLHAPPPGAVTATDTDSCEGKQEKPTDHFACRYTAANLASWGVVAWYKTYDGKHETYWGTTTGIAKVKGAHR